MSKHHHYHPSHSGSFHSTTKKTHLDHHDSDMMIPSSHGSNGLRQNGILNGDLDSNDTNNNYNKHHNTHHKRSAGGSGEGSSSKRTKLNVPSDKSGKVVDTGGSMRPQQSHYNIIEKLKELYKELKHDKSCKEVNIFFN